METITIAKVKNLITARPKEMPFDVYRKLRKEQQMMLHGYSVVEKQNGVFVRRVATFPVALTACAFRQRTGLTRATSKSY